MRTRSKSWKQGFYSEKFVYDSFCKVFKPGSKVYFTYEFIIISKLSNCLKILCNILVVIVFETKKIKSVEPHLGKQYFRGQPGCPSVAIHKRVNNNHLLMKYTGDNKRIYLFSFFIHKLDKIHHKWTN